MDYGTERRHERIRYMTPEDLREKTEAEKFEGWECKVHPKINKSRFFKGVCQRQKDKHKKE